MTTTQSNDTNVQLAGRTLWVPRMTYVSATFFAAVFRSIGIDAHVTPESDERTLELGGLYTSGEECYPEKITLGDFLRIIHAEDFDPDRTAFFMPTAEGPCRFGQYAPYLKQVLRDMGYPDVPVISPTSKNSYDGLGGDRGMEMIRLLWRGLIAGDILRKMLLKTRPYETQKGAADEAFEWSVRRIEGVLEKPDVKPRDRMAEIIAALDECREKFHAVPARYTRDKPLIGVVGEIFCRMNTFSNYEAVRQIESHGGECWLSDVGEWVWYTNWSQQELLRRDGKRLSLSMLAAVLKNKVQRSDENKLLEVFAEDFVGYEEPHDIYHEVLEPAWPYLPADGALGEMVLSIGKSIYLHGKGADGIVDISPFSCMNGIVSEAVYHDVSADHDRMPMDIFMELAESYKRRKSIPRRYPAFFRQ
jgi:predicted nucleotide-binding protein (sugar kinase/HSP70/actin superfamily)